LFAQGPGYSWTPPAHFRIFPLPYTNQIEEAMGKLERFLQTYRQ